MLPNHGVAHEKLPESSAKPGIQTPEFTKFLPNSPDESETGSREVLANPGRYHSHVILRNIGKICFACMSEAIAEKAA